MIADVRHTSMYKCALYAMRKYMKLNSDGGDFAARNANDAMESVFGGSLE
jgi:hypothetical protein